MAILLIIAGLFLAFSNGGNDNFKGVATLLGSGTTSYKQALAWATITTFLGSVVALYLAQGLLQNFSGKGLVPDDVVKLSSFSTAVALASALTVFAATRLGFPISTTHALTGALVGAGFMAAPQGIHIHHLMNSFVAPLLLGPLLAIVGATLLYPLASKVRRQFGVTRESCLCVGREVIAPTSSIRFVQVLPLSQPMNQMTRFIEMPTVSVGNQLSCAERYVGTFWGVDAKSAVDATHVLSAGLVSFARGLNDIPKIAAIMLAAAAVTPSQSIVSVAMVMALGGVVMAKRIANTMAYEITTMNDGQGVSANLVTSLVVIGASRMGLPVSTTHVSCGALFGIGAVTKQAHGGAILKIALAWITTLPLAAMLGAMLFVLLSR